MAGEGNKGAVGRKVVKEDDKTQVPVSERDLISMRKVICEDHKDSFCMQCHKCTRQSTESAMRSKVKSPADAQHTHIYT